MAPPWGLRGKVGRWFPRPLVRKPPSAARRFAVFHAGEDDGMQERDPFGPMATRGGRVRVYGCSPGCLLLSLAVSVLLTILVNVLIRLL
jgi:hypothetical protein